MRKPSKSPAPRTRRPRTKPVEQTRISLPVHGSTVTAGDLRDRALAAIDASTPLNFDGADVESIGQAVLQVLVAARHEALAQGGAFTIANPSAALLARISACRLESALGIASQEETAQ